MIGLAVRCTAVGAAVLLAACPSAWAISPPEVDPNFAPPSGSAGPETPMSQRGECVTTGVTPAFDAAAVPAAQTMLNLAGAWQFSRGEGQTVAVISTGVQPGPRLPDVDGGGDYVAGTDGRTDCDGHGTLVAGIIAGQPGADGFSGVAPAARILAIRQTSAMYAPTSPDEDQDAQRAGIAIDSLARAVVRAADEGARVITISPVTCLGPDATIDQNPLGAALRYAAVERDVVIVAAAGDAGAGGVGGGLACQSNPLNNTGAPDDPRNWAGVTSVSVPSSWQPYVLSVGSQTPQGQPSPFTMAGPWVGIAGPGQGIVSVSNAPDGGLADGLPDRAGFAPINGSGYAAAYVAGVAALVRSRFPDMPARDVIERLTATAHNGAYSPSNLVGTGTVDPVAALTWQLPERASDEDGTVTRIAAPTAPEPVDHLPRTIALGGAAALAVAVAATALIATRRKDSAT